MDLIGINFIIILKAEEQVINIQIKNLINNKNNKTTSNKKLPDSLTESI